MYVAPEVLKQHYSLPADVWSAGIVTYQLLTGRLPFAGEEGSEVSTSFKEGRGCRNKVILVAGFTMWACGCWILLVDFK